MAQGGTDREKRTAAQRGKNSFGRVPAAAETEGLHLYQRSPQGPVQWAPGRFRLPKGSKLIQQLSVIQICPSDNDLLSAAQGAASLLGGLNHIKILIL